MANDLKTQKEKCNMCDGNMIKVDNKEIDDTHYNIFRCEKCNHEVARSTD